MSNHLPDVPIYLAIRRPDECSHMQDTLVLDGFHVVAFPTAELLWETFRQRQARIVISDRRFGEGLSGVDLTRAIRRDFLVPYCYVVLRSTMNHLPEIEEGLAAGADDYLLKPHNPIELRSRIMVGLRWLAYIDSLNEPQTT
jgi:DNA-binding response OmpR family regulator